MLKIPLTAEGVVSAGTRTPTSISAMCSAIVTVRGWLLTGMPGSSVQQTMWRFISFMTSPGTFTGCHPLVVSFHAVTIIAASFSVPAAIASARKCRSLGGSLTHWGCSSISS